MILKIKLPDEREVKIERIGSDSHFSHANIIKYCGRPYKDAHHMNCEMTSYWNSIIGPEDWVLHCGDFSFSPDRILHRLNGNIILLRGNHDKKRHGHLYAAVFNHLDIKVGEFNCRFQHFPVHPDEKYKKHGTQDLNLLKLYDFIICGHRHEAWVVKGQNINVGVDAWNMKMLTPDDLLRFMRKCRDEKIDFMLPKNNDFENEVI